MNQIDIPRCSKRCCRTDRPLAPGETYYSALFEGRQGLERLDFSVEAWNNETRRPIGWWKSVIPSTDDRRIRLASNDILFDLFDQWLGDGEKAEYLYILTLLMVRRRLLRFEKSGEGELGNDEMTVYAARREQSYTIQAATLDADAIAKIQNTLAELIYSAPDDI